MGEEQGPGKDGALAALTQPQLFFSRRGTECAYIRVIERKIYLCFGFSPAV